jgi:hypothetical protein
MPGIVEPADAGISNPLRLRDEVLSMFGRSRNAAAKENLLPIAVPSNGAPRRATRGQNEKVLAVS